MDEDEDAGKSQTLVKAMRSDNVNLVRSLLHQGVDVCSGRPDGAIHAGAQANALESVQLLVQTATKESRQRKQELLSHRNRLAETPLHVAAKFGHIQMAEFLLNAADSKESYCALPDLSGNTAMHTASSTGDCELVDSLLVMGGLALLERKNRAGERPVHVAAACGRLETLMRLIDAGADVNRQNNNGEVWLWWCGAVV